MCRKAERANFPLDNTEQMSYIVCEGLCRVYLMHSTGKLFGQLPVLFRCPRPVINPAVYPGGIIAGFIFLPVCPQFLASHIQQNYSPVTAAGQQICELVVSPEKVNCNRFAQSVSRFFLDIRVLSV